MFGIGMPEMILILAVALIVIGPKKLPDLAKSLGKAMGEFKKATSDLKESMQIDSELKEVKTAFDDLSKEDRPAASADEAPVETAPEADAEIEASTGETDSMDNLKAAFDRHNDEEKPAGTDSGADDPKSSRPDNDRG